MKSLVYIFTFAALVMLSACHRNYKVNYARVAVDTTARDDMDEYYTQEDSDGSAASWEDTPLFEDAQFEGGVEDSRAAQREYRKFINGNE